LIVIDIGNRNTKFQIKNSTEFLSENIATIVFNYDFIVVSFVFIKTLFLKKKSPK